MAEDQATGLRRLFADQHHGTLAVCGNDSTEVAVRIASALTALDCRVLVLDRSVGEVAATLDLKARYDLGHVLAGDKCLDEVILMAQDGVAVLPATRGLQRLAAETPDWQGALRGALPALRSSFDVWLVNGLPPGGSPDTHIALVLDPTTRAITTVYGQIKVLQLAQGHQEFGVIVRDAASAEAAQVVFSCVASAANRFLAARLAFLGNVPTVRSSVAEAIRERLGGGESFMRLAETLLCNLRTGAGWCPVTA